MISATDVKTSARQLGFSACGLAPAARVAPWQEERVRQWLAAKRNGNMDYLERHLQLRLDPTLLVEGAQTVVSVALNYYPRQTLSARGYSFARYAYGKDYHDVVRRKLRQLMAALGLDEPADGRPFCDTAPIDERYWAWRAGLGWIGRNTQLIIAPTAAGDRQAAGGSYFFLGELVLTREADAYDAPIASRCGKCRACIDRCPTRALSGEGLDARRCLSYLTIEHRGELPPDTGELMGQCVYGCDRCSEACPWNRLSQPATDPDLQPTEEFLGMTQADWNALTPERYRRLFKGSAVKRAKYEGLMRNIRAARKASDKIEH